MANSNFIVQNGLTVGSTTIDAATGNITLPSGSAIYVGGAAVTPGGSSNFSALTVTGSAQVNTLTVNTAANVGTDLTVIGNLYVGSGANASAFTNPIFIGVDSGAGYVQAAIVNSFGNASADFTAYANNGTDVQGWMDMGMTGNVFNDSKYTITGFNDGYIFANGVTGNSSLGGNLVIATGSGGATNDIVFATGGFLTANEVMRYRNSGNLLSIKGASITGGNATVNGLAVNTSATISTTLGVSGITRVLDTTDSSGTLTGALQVSGGASISKNLYVAGNIYATNVIAISTANITVQDPLLYLTANVTYPYNYAIGMYSQFTGGTGNIYQHTGMVRDQSDGVWKFFSNVVSEPSLSVDFTNAIYDSIRVGAITSNGATFSGTVQPSANASIGLGTTGAYWGTAYINALNCPTITGGTFSGVSTTAKYADLAENYLADAVYAPGTVVVFGGDKEITISNQTHDNRVAGVVSTKPAYLMNSDLKNSTPVAFTGRVPCHVRGPVYKGQPLVQGMNWGVAEGLNPDYFTPGCVLGKALEEIADNSIQTIEIVVGRF